jgi:hypothetical protein
VNVVVFDRLHINGAGMGEIGIAVCCHRLDGTKYPDEDLELHDRDVGVDPVRRAGRALRPALGLHAGRDVRARVERVAHQRAVALAT